MPTKQSSNAKNAGKSAEDDVLTSLQRLQRQYQGINVSSNIHSTSAASRTDRPLDPIATSMGKELAQQFQALHVREIPKGLQEKALVALCNKQVPTNVLSGFLSTLLSHSSPLLGGNRANDSNESTNENDTYIQLDWLPQWMVHCEHEHMESTKAASLSSLALSSPSKKKMGRYHRAAIVRRNYAPQHQHQQPYLEALTIVSRAYAHYEHAKLVQYYHSASNHNMSNANHLTTTSQDIAMTYRRFQTDAGRVSFLRECVRIAFLHYGQNTGDNINVEGLSSILRSMLSPLMSATALTVSTRPFISSLYLQEIWRESWALTDRIPQAEIMLCRIWNILTWQTQGLDLFLHSISCRSEAQFIDGDGIAAKELATQWFRTLLELAAYVASSISIATDSDIRETSAEDHDTEGETNPEDPYAEKIQDWLQYILGQTLPLWFATLPSYCISFESGYQSILNIISKLLGDSEQHLLVPMNDTTLFRLATLALSTPQDADIVMRILSSMTSTNPTTTDTWQNVLQALECILFGQHKTEQRSNHITAAASVTSHRISSSMSSGASIGKRLRKDPNQEIQNMIQFLDGSVVDMEEFIHFIAPPTGNVDMGSDSSIHDDDEPLPSNVFPPDVQYPLSTIQQNGALMLGLALSEVDSAAASRYWKQLIPAYPHLGICLLPVWMDSINQSSKAGDGAALIQQLELLCTTLILDKHCAKEVWNLVGNQLLEPDIPVMIRSSLIRFFPKICAANKRLYKRVIEALGKSLEVAKKNSSQILDQTAIVEAGQIRIAVVATLADMARDALIRDVSDVIGWIQAFIMEGSMANRFTISDNETPVHTVVVHFALQCLHYLLASQELDFSLVLVILNKHLCDVHDLSQTIKLPLLIMEPLVKLLGDGECDDLDSEGEEEETNPEIVGVLPQVSKAVETLLTLAHSSRLQLNHNVPAAEYNLVLRIRESIIESLSRYSPLALGLDAEGLRSITGEMDAANHKEALPTVIRYKSIMKVIDNAMDQSFKENEGHAAKKINKHSVCRFIEKVVLFEQEVFGSNLWQKKGMTSRKTKSQQVGGEKTDVSDQETLSALPQTTKVQRMYNENPSPTSSVAMLLCFEGKPMTLLNDIALDITAETTDPLVQAFTVQGWLNASRRMLLEIADGSGGQGTGQGLMDILDVIREWKTHHETPDNSLAALSAVAVCSFEILDADQNISKIIVDVCDEVWEAYSQHNFENTKCDKISLGFVGVCMVRNQSEKLSKVLGALMTSIAGHGEEASFGAFFGLAMIVQALANEEKTLKSERNVGLIKTVVGFLVEQMASFVAGSHPDLQNLVDCIKSGTSPNVARLTSLGKKNLQIIKSKASVAKGLFIAFSLSLPALSIVNDELLLGVYCMLEGIAWGSGKGIALPSVLRACRQSGMFEHRQMEQIYSRYAKVFEDGMENKSRFLDDILFAVAATMSKTIPDSIRRFLVGNRNIFDEEGRALSIVATMVSITSVPCLGCGTDRFTDFPSLLPTASKVDIKDIVALIASGTGTHGWNKYAEMCILLTGFMASINHSAMIEPSDVSNTTTTTSSSDHSVKDCPHDSDPAISRIPTPRSGTVLERVVAALADLFADTNQGASRKQSKVEAVVLLKTLQNLTLPGHFATIVRDILRGGDEQTKVICSRLLASQIAGKSDAVYGGKEFVSLALQIANTPIASMRGYLGNEEGSQIFIEAMSDFIPKVHSDVVAETVENLWRFCISQVGQNPSWAVSYLAAMERMMKRMKDVKASMSPKVCTLLRTHVLKRVFVGIRDAQWTAASRVSHTEEQLILEAYADCLEEIPVEVLGKADIFSLKGTDGFAGEALRSRCIMTLVRNGYFTTPARASSEIAVSITWFSRQLASSEDEIFSSSLLRVACAITEATVGENDDKRRDLLLRMLDNFILTGAAAAPVALQFLGALVGKWTDGIGSDGHLSLGRLAVHGMSEWQRLSPPTLQQFFALVLYDLPYNFALYCRGEEISDAAFDRLLQVHSKWKEIGADQATIDCVRDMLVCCRYGDSGEEDFVAVGTSLLL